MAEEVLRLRTTIIPDHAGARQVQNNLRETAREGERATRQLKTGMDQVGGSLRSVSRDLNLFKGVFAGVSVYKVAQAFNDIAKNMMDMSRTSRALGMAERDLRGLALAGARVGISQQQVFASLKNVDQKLFEIHHRIGDTAARFVGMGAGPVINAIARATNTTEKFREVLKFKDTLLDRGQRQEAIAWLNEWNIGLEYLEQNADDAASAMEKVGKSIDPETAKKFTKASADLGEAWGRLTTKLGVALFPKLTEDVENIEAMVDWFTKLDEKVDSFKEKWKSLKEGGEGFATPFTGGSINIQPETGAGTGLDAGNIPQFQTGGISRRGGLSLLHPNEAVIPLGNEDVLRGSAQTLERADEEGTFRALVRFASYTQMGGLGGLPGLGGGGGPGVGGAGGTGGLGGGGGRGGGGGKGGDDPAGQQNTTDPQPSAADGLTAGPKGNVMPSNLMGLERGPAGAGGNAWSAAGGTATGTLSLPAGAAIPGAQGNAASGGGLSKEAYEKTFAGTPLAGKYDQVVAAANKNGVPPATMAAVMAFESRKGQHKPAQERNNYFGGMTGKDSKQHMRFGSVDEGIEAAGKTIGNNWKRAGGDLQKMGARYAPPNAANDPGGTNAQWPKAVGDYQKKLADAGTPANGQASPPAAAQPTKVASLDQSQTPIPGAGPLSNQSGRPDKMVGRVDLPGGQSYRYTSGGVRGYPSVPYGTHNINIGKRAAIGPIGQRIGSIATLGTSGGNIYDQREGRTREGIQIHKLRGLATQGCFGVDPKDWPAFEKSLMDLERQHPGQLALTIGKDGKANIHLRGQGAIVSGGVPSEALKRPNIGGGVGFGGGGERAPGTGIGDLSNLSEANRPKFDPGKRFVTNQTRLAGDLAGLGTSPEKELDRVNGNANAPAQSSVNLEVKHDGTKASAKVASSKGPGFAQSKIKNQTQMQPTDEFGATGNP